MIDATQIWDGTVTYPAGGGDPIVAGAAVTVDRVSTNVIDMLVARDVGAGDMLEAHVVITETFLTTVSMQINYQTSPDNITFVTVMSSPVVLVANLVVGALIFQYKVPKFQLNDTGTPNRYHQLQYDISTTATAGKVFAYMTAGGDRVAYVTYPSGFTIAA